MINTTVPHKGPLIISFGGGKGGTGKSTMAVNIGTMLTQKGYSVGFIDADLGGANLHTFLGVKRPTHTLNEYLADTTSDLSTVIEKTVVDNSWLISGASDILEVANPKNEQKQRIIANLSTLEADFIIVDIGAGSNANSTDFFSAFQYGAIVIDGLPTSIENAYGFLKNSIIRGLARLFPQRIDIQRVIWRFANPLASGGLATVDELIAAVHVRFPEESTIMRRWLAAKTIFLIINMVRDQNDITAGSRFTEIIKKYLSVACIYTGYVIFDTEIRRSIKEMRPLALNTTSRPVLDCLTAITDNIVTLTKGAT